MTSVLRLYKDALIDLYGNNAKGQARDKFRAGSSRWPQFCDFYRGEVAARETATPLLRDFKQIHDTIDTYGELSIATQQPAAYPRFEYVATEFFNTPFPVTTRTLFLAAYGAILVEHQRYRQADEVLSNVKDQNNPWVLAAYCYLYWETQRWTDLARTALQLNKSYWIDPLTEHTRTRNGKKVRDRFLRSLSVVLAGEAYLRLSNDKTAEEVLLSVVDTEYSYLASYAYVLLCYMERQRGNTTKATKYLTNAQSVAETLHTDHAEDDPTRLLSSSTAEKINARTDKWDPTTEPVQQVPDGISAERARLILEAEEELAAMIGMESVKDSIRTMRREIEYNAARHQRGFPVQAVSRHLILSGPAGTGKTSIARIIAKYYAGYGIVEKPNLVVATRSDLIGSTEGATAKMTQDVFDSALGGVLFIDEAPDMIQDREGELDHRGQEAISILLQNIENHREGTIVIFAGYEGGMQRLLNTNEGLRSRFPNWIMFETYSPDEIAQIASSIAFNRNNVLSSKAVDTIKQRAEDIQSADYSGMKVIDKLGNGRFARNIIEGAELNRVRRLGGVNLNKLDDTSMLTLTVEDVDTAARELIESAL